MNDGLVFRELEYPEELESSICDLAFLNQEKTGGYNTNAFIVGILRQVADDPNKFGFKPIPKK